MPLIFKQLKIQPIAFKIRSSVYVQFIKGDDVDGDSKYSDLRALLGVERVK